MESEREELRKIYRFLMGMSRYFEVPFPGCTGVSEFSFGSS